MIFDLRVFIGESFNGLSQTADELLANMDDLNIDMALACPFKPLFYDLRQANQDLSTAIEKHTDRLVGAARIDPWQPDAAQTLVWSVDELGMQALFLNPWEENFQADSPKLDEVMAAAQDRELPVLISAGYPWLSEASQIAGLASRWPQVPIVMTNGGQINISGLGQSGAALALSKHSSLSFDTAGIYRQDFIDAMVEKFNGNRVFFASGSPYFDQRYEILRVKLAHLNEGYRQKVAGGNAVKLLGIDTL